ncbi:MAG: hypothetical protein CL878_14710 [Dehalococcoidia bacterium]|nr:hypothetical protein [Dehalococcoidia bacterium]
MTLEGAFLPILLWDWINSKVIPMTELAQEPATDTAAAIIFIHTRSVRRPILRAMGFHAGVNPAVPSSQARPVRLR